MHSSNGGDAQTATTALNSRDTAFSMPSDHSSAVWERQSLGRDKFDRERHASTKRDWTVESRSSSYRSSGILSGSGNLSASSNKRRAIGRHETGVENGRYRSAVGRSSDSSTFLRSSPQIGKGERDVCSAGYVGSPTKEPSNKAVDGHYYRDTHVSPSNARSLSGPRFDSRFHGNLNDSEVLGPWDRERSRFNSPSYTWDAPNRCSDFREKTWSRPDYRRAYALPKLESCREWSQSDRELLEGRIDRYSSVSGRDGGSTGGREHSRHEWRGRDRISSNIPAYPPTSSLYNRDSKHASLAFEASGAVSPPQHSPMQSTFSHESDQDCSPSTSKKRPRLTWGQGLAKYEKEKTGEDLPVTKKPEERSSNVGGVYSDVSDASALPEGSLQTTNALPYLEERHPSEERIHNSDQSGWLMEPSRQESVVCLNEKDATREAQADGDADQCSIIVKPGEISAFEAAHAASSPQNPVLEYIQAFLKKYEQELPDLSKDILTQHVEKVEFEIDRLEKEIMRIDNEQDKDTIAPETKLEETLDVSNLDNVRVLQSAPSPLHVQNCLGSPVSFAAVTVNAGECGEPGLLGDAVHAVMDSMDEDEVTEPCAHQAVREGMIGITERNAKLIAQSRAVKRKRVSAELKMSRAFEEEYLKDSITSIVLSNYKTAEESSSALAHLQGRGDLCISGWANGNSQESSAWKHRAERHEKMRSYLQVRVTEAKSLVKFTEGVLAVKYMAKWEAWKQKRNGNCVSTDRDICVGTWDPDDLTPSRHIPLKICPVFTAGSFVPESQNMDLQLAKKLVAESPSQRKRCYMKMPPMILGQKERDAHIFKSTNALVEDPVAAEQERKAVNPWSEDEKRIFLDKYSLLGKNLRKIASFLEHKTVADCVQFFYLNQKTEEFEKIHRKHQLKKRRECRASALYLATTTSASSRHQEANAAYVEGLSLVAAAAAAMSAPRQLSRSARSPALKPCPPGSFISKTCHESHLMKQTSMTSTILTIKDSNVEHLGGKCDPKTHSRSLKRPPEEVLQWRSQWNDDERDLFLKAVTLFGKDFERISAFIGTKSLGQCKAYFSKARKRLGLDQLVERHMAILESKQQGENLPKEMQGKNLELHTPGMKVEMGGDSLEQQVKVEQSPHRANLCMASEFRCNSPHESQEVISTLSHLKTMQAMDQTGSVLLNGNVSQPNVISSLNRGRSLPLHDACGDALRAGASPTTVVQGCANESGEAEEIKAEPMNVKAETVLVTQMSIGASNLSTSSIYGSSPSTALLPSSLAQSSLVQGPQGKEKNFKAGEVKARREPTSWTQEEKDKFVEVLKVHGKNWDLLRNSLPAKSLIQIKTYFQNSKAKLGLGSDGAVNNSGRAGSSWKRKIDDSDSSSNAGSAGQMLSQQACVSSDEGCLKGNPSTLAQSGCQGNNIFSAEALAYANIVGRKLLEDSINVQKVFHAMGLTQNTSSPGILPMLTTLTTPVFSQPNLASVQQPFMHTAAATMKVPHAVGHQQPEQYLASMMVVEPSSSVGIHQTHLLPLEQQVAGTCQDPSLQSVHKQPLQVDQKNLFQHVPSQNLQLQQMAEAVLQQLLPQAVQRYQQQLQLAAQQAPHHLEQPLNHHQALSNWQVPSQASAGTIPASMATGQQKQQSQLHPMHGKLQALLQQHQPVPQPNQHQLLQLQSQQQQQQQLLLRLQQAQAPSQSHQIQNQTLHMQHSHNLSNEQQEQHPPFFRGFTQLPCGGVEASKQSDFDVQTLNKVQQGASGDFHQPFILNQTVGAPSKPHFVPEQSSAGDVKLFGQSLLLQPASVSQHLHASSSSELASTSALATAIAAGTMSTNVPTKVSWDRGIQGHEGHLVARPSALSNGGTVVSGKGDYEMGRSCIQEPLPCFNKMQVRDANAGKVADIKPLSDVSQLPDSNTVSSDRISLENCSALNSTDVSFGPSGASERCDRDNEKTKSGMVCNLDHVTDRAANLDEDRKQEPSCIARSIGGEAEGLPRVLDALVALAEWRLQNSEGCSGKLSDEFLSQSWEALQKDPGSLVQAGKISGSLAQLYPEGQEMLNYLREHLLSSPSGFMLVSSSSGSAAEPIPDGAILSNVKQIVSTDPMLPQSSMQDPARSDPAGSECEVTEADGS